MKTIEQAKRRKRLSRIIIGSVLMGFGIVILLAILLVAKIIKQTPDVSELDLKATTNSTSFVYDGEENIIDKFSGMESREYAHLEKIPKQLRQAVIAIEDKNFYEHNGMDLSSIGKALVSNLKSGSISDGGTTLTGQVIKHNLLASGNSIERKIQEQYLAIQFEKLYTKDLILEYYLNSVALGQGTIGVQAAALRYFGKDVSELNLTECAVLTAIIEFPTRYNPILYPDKNWEKVQVILGEMEKQGYITETEKIEALKFSPYERIKTVHQETLKKAATVILGQK
jgi:penicillin-binding protein 1A